MVGNTFTKQQKSIQLKKDIINKIQQTLIVNSVRK